MEFDLFTKIGLTLFIYGIPVFAILIFIGIKLDNVFVVIGSFIPIIVGILMLLVKIFISVFFMIWF